MSDENEQKTKSMTVRVNVEFSNGDKKCTYIVITGVPEDLPQEYESTVIRSAEAQFASALNQRTYIEFYAPCKTSKDEQPVFINMSTVAWLKVTSVEKVEF